MYDIAIESSLVEAIRSGAKTIEVGLGKPRFLQIQPGDTLRIREDIWRDGECIGAHDDSLRVKVTQVLYFESFEEMLEAVDYEAAVPTAKSLEDALATYAQFYSTTDEADYGVVAFYFSVIEQ